MIDYPPRNWIAEFTSVMDQIQKDENRAIVFLVRDFYGIIHIELFIIRIPI